QPGQQGGQPGQGNQAGNPQQGGQPGGRQSSQMGDRVGPTGNPGGGNRKGQVYGDLDTGNQHFTGGRTVPTQQSFNPADTQRQIEQGLNLLNSVRGAVQDSPEARQQLQTLVEEM